MHMHVLKLRAHIICGRPMFPWDRTVFVIVMMDDGDGDGEISDADTVGQKLSSQNLSSNKQYYSTVNVVTVPPIIAINHSTAHAMRTELLIVMDFDSLRAQCITHYAVPHSTSAASDYTPQERKEAAAVRVPRSAAAPPGPECCAEANPELYVQRNVRVTQVA